MDEEATTEQRTRRRMRSMPLALALAAAVFANETRANLEKPNIALKHAKVDVAKTYDNSFVERALAEHAK